MLRARGLLNLQLLMVMIDLASLNAKVILKGKVLLKVFDVETMKLLQTVEIENLVVNVGLQEALDLMFALEATAFSYIAVGSDNTTPAAGDTALGSEIARKDRDECSRSAQTVTVKVWFGANEGTGTWREGAIFNAASSGVMLCRALFSEAVTKDSTKVVQVEWTITASAT